MKWKKRVCTVLCALGSLAAFDSRAAESPVPPPAAPAKGSASELEKLVAPIALYPDSLIATLLPAAVYPLEIVQAARFVKDTNNLAKLDDQPWDENVKAVARVPAVIQKLNDELAWTADLGQAFLEQPKEMMDMIQSLRAKAQALGTLKTTPEQVVVVTNVVVVQTNITQIVTVTNQVVQVYPSNPQVVYVPAYDPWYAYYPPPVYYVGPPPVVTFAVGVTVGLIIANNCDWHHGGIYVGHHGVAMWGGGHGNVDIDINRNVNINTGNINTGNINSGNRPKAQKWQPEQSRLSKSGAPGSAATAQARGWSASAMPATRPSPPASRPASPSSFNRPSAAPEFSRPAASPSASSFGRAGSPSASRESAFGGLNSGGGVRDFSSRGSFSRGGGGGRSFRGRR